MTGCLLKNLRTLQDFEIYRDAPEACAYIAYATFKFVIICVIYKHCLKCFCTRYGDHDDIYCCPDILTKVVGVIFGAPLGVVERSAGEYKQSNELINSDGDNAMKQEETNKEKAINRRLTVCIHRKKNKGKIIEYLACQKKKQ